MNKERRKCLGEAYNLFQKSIDILVEAQGIIENCKDEEQEAYDNLPSNLQDGEKGSTMGDIIDDLWSISDIVVEVVDSITTAQGLINGITND